ncbi:glycosyltransferase family 2 protein [Cytophaga aurantiaca]|uniref:glycosyltransferase family 2 protein n=1 Tax=Cytophaga aurantiaca TaxID=29530 RepID=UPI00035F528B|nr:glycosyltransferase family 2 protein [Cytophaga aurantiaca]
MTSPQVSIIVPSYNGRNKVIRLLNSLEQQTYRSFEVIVVLDGSTDGSAAAIHSIEWKLFPLKIIEQKNNGRASARNTGAAQATTELLLFFDDDMIPASSCIQEFISFNSTHKNRIALGEILEPATKEDSEIKKYKDYLNTTWNSTLKTYRNAVIPSERVVLSAANFSIPTSLFNKLKGFDESLKDIEDYDFALRARVEKIETFYLDTAIAVHLDQFTFRKYAERSKAYLKNRILAASLKPDLYGQDPILKHQHKLFLKGLYSVMKYPFWLNLFDAGILQFVLPEKLRYKLYGVAITAYIHNQPKAGQ